MSKPHDIFKPDRKCLQSFRKRLVKLVEGVAHTLYVLSKGDGNTEARNYETTEAQIPLFPKRRATKYPGMSSLIKMNRTYKRHHSKVHGHILLASLSPLQQLQ